MVLRKFSVREGAITIKTFNNYCNQMDSLKNRSGTLNFSAFNDSTINSVLDLFNLADCFECLDRWTIVATSNLDHEAYSNPISIKRRTEIQEEGYSRSVEAFR